MSRPPTASQPTPQPPQNTPSLPSLRTHPPGSHVVAVDEDVPSVFRVRLDLKRRRARLCVGHAVLWIVQDERALVHAHVPEQLAVGRPGRGRHRQVAGLVSGGARRSCGAAVAVEHVCQPGGGGGAAQWQAALQQQRVRGQDAQGCREADSPQQPLLLASLGLHRGRRRRGVAAATLPPLPLPTVGSQPGSRCASHCLLQSQGRCCCSKRAGVRIRLCGRPAAGDVRCQARPLRDGVDARCEVNRQ